MIIKIDENSKRVYVKEFWYDYLYLVASVKFIEQGQMIPKYYLPLKQTTTPSRMDWGYCECWIIPLAIPVMVYYIFRNALRGVWTWLFIWNRKMEEENDKSRRIS